MQHSSDEFGYSPAFQFLDGGLDRVKRWPLSTDRSFIYVVAQELEGRNGVSVEVVQLKEEALRRRDKDACLWKSLNYTYLDVRKWMWQAEQGNRQGFSHGFLGRVSEILKGIPNKSPDRVIIVNIGEGIRKYVTTDCKMVFFGPILEQYENDVRFVMQFYNSVCEETRKECIAWILCALALRLCKDVRVVIVGFVWKSRLESIESRWKVDVPLPRRRRN